MPDFISFCNVLWSALNTSVQILFHFIMCLVSFPFYELLVLHSVLVCMHCLCLVLFQFV